MTDNTVVSLDSSASKEESEAPGRSVTPLGPVRHTRMRRTRDAIRAASTVAHTFEVEHNRYYEQLVSQARDEEEIEWEMMVYEDECVKPEGYITNTHMNFFTDGPMGQDVDSQFDSWAKVGGIPEDIFSEQPRSLTIQVTIGLEGGGASKGDGPEGLRADNSSSIRDSEGKRKQKRQWKVKRVVHGARSGKDNLLVASSLSDAESKVRGDLDALKELVTEIKHGDDSPKSPPPSDKKEKEPSGPVQHDVETMRKLKEKFSFDIHETSDFGRSWILTALLFWLTYMTMYHIRPFFKFSLGLGEIDIHLNILLGMGLRLVVSRSITIVLFFLLPTWLTRGRRISEKYRFLRSLKAHDELDLRADTISLGKLKHKRAEFMEVSCFVRKPYLYWFTRWTQTDIIVSAELLSQLNTANNANLTCDNETVFQKIYHSAKSIHSVNISRYATLENINIVQNTAVLAYAMHRKMLEQLEELNFPRPQRRAP